MTAVMSSAAYEFGDFVLQNQHPSSPAMHPDLMFQQQASQLLTMETLNAHTQLMRQVSSPESQQSVTLTPASLLNTVSSLLPVLENIKLQNEHRRLDRSQSEPISSNRAWPQGVNSSRYKTELCRPFEENGSCKYGDKCQFAHGSHELRGLIRHPKYKTELCRTFHTIGFCPYGPRCHFIHNAEEQRPSYQLVASIRRPTPLNISTFSGSASGSPSPTSSLSQSPTSSGSFFNDYEAASPPPIGQAQNAYTLIFRPSNSSSPEPESKLGSFATDFGAFMREYEA